MLSMLTLVVLSLLVPVGIVLGLFFAQWGIPWEAPIGVPAPALDVGVE